MEKYTANYTYTNPNFVIQNIKGPTLINNKYYQVYCVLKNVIQRGYPTTMSIYLQKEIGKIHLDDDFNENVILIDNEVPVWLDSIEGDEENNYYPALSFFEECILEYFDEHKYIQQLIIPEAPFSQIVKDVADEFVGQRVDFYLPQAKLVIEIDGQHHKSNDIERIKDKSRDKYLSKHGIKTIRINTKDLELKNTEFNKKIDEIKNRLNEYRVILKYYEKYYYNQILYTTEYNIKVLRATAVIRFQVTILSLLQKGILNLNDDIWRFNILQRDISDFAEIAIKDLFIWLTNLCKLRKLPIDVPDIEIIYCDSEKNFIYEDDIINIDFSLLKKWTDVNKNYPEVLFVRTDYYDRENYFKVSTSDPIRYQIINDGEQSDIPALKFMLENIFGFEDFKGGQLPIIINTLACVDTIGILPTGAGKSLCYQFCALLQPCISFVVCPIKSLMYDQKYNTDKLYITHSNHITSDQSGKEKSEVSKSFSEGRYFFIWISPERFQSQDFRNYLDQLNKTQTIALAVIDEVHCLSEWGHDFRTSYLNLVKTIIKYCPSATLLGLTATASSFVLEDLKTEFSVTADNIKTLTSFSRPELNFRVIKDEGRNLETKANTLFYLLNRINKSKNIFNLDGKDTKSGIIFTQLINGQLGCYNLASEISRKFNINSLWYSGGIPTMNVYNKDKRAKRIPVMKEQDFDKYKMKVQKGFQNNEFPLLVATKAFGMGINKKNIRYTIHYGIPGSLESLYQEAGRAGRDGEQSNCYVLYTKERMPKEELEVLFNLETSIDEIKMIQEKYGYKDGRDILRNFFFGLNSNKGVDYELDIMNLIYKKYVEKDIIEGDEQYHTKLIKCCNFEGSFSDVQKAVYKLSLLGIVDDWIIESWNANNEVIKAKIKVSVNQDNIKGFEEITNLHNKSIFHNLSEYIRKYDKEFDLEDKDKENDKNKNYRKYISIYKDHAIDEHERAMRILLEWNYDNIVYNSRQSIKTIMELCDNFDNEETFKEHIESYFRYSEKSYVLDHIAQNPNDIKSWVDIFYETDDKKVTETSKTKQKIFISKEELINIKGSLSRLLESYRYNTGLNYVSGIVRFLLGEFENVDGKSRLESALKQIVTYDKEEQTKILFETLDICSVPENNKEELSELLCTYFKYEKIHIHSYLQDNYSLLLIVDESNNRLQKIMGMI